MGTIVSTDYTELKFQYMRVNGQPETLLGFLLRKFRYHNREEWLDHVESGRLLVNQRDGDPNQLLKNGQTITYRRPDYLEPDVDRSFDVLFEDEFLIAVNKSGDLPTSPSGRYFKNTLVHVLKQAFDWEDLYTLHRLDRETSGVLIFAKQKSVAQEMGHQFRTQQVKKKYTAVLSQPLPYKEVFISMPIGREADSTIRIKQGVVPTGKPSQTHFCELERFGPYAKVQVSPQTGRTHQIRVHAAYLEAPIVGDKLYGLPDDGFVKWLHEGSDFLVEQGFPAHRQLLHASQLRFTHPVTQEILMLEASDAKMMEHVTSHLS